MRGFGSASAALILVDLQVAFCSGESTIAERGFDTRKCGAAAAKCFDLAGWARDRGMPVIWTRMVFRSDYADGGLLTDRIRPGIRESRSLIDGNEDAKLLEPGSLPGDFVIDKQRYSAFYGTPLDVVLRSLGVNELIVAGVTTSMCVESTVRDAAHRDYDVIVVSDACGDFDDAWHESALRALDYGFATVVSSCDEQFC